MKLFTLLASSVLVGIFWHNIMPNFSGFIFNLITCSIIGWEWENIYAYLQELVK